MAGPATLVDIGTLVYSRPDFRHGKPCIAGTGMSVQRVAIYHQMGMSPEEIQADVDHIPLANIYAALACYYANKAIIDDQIADDQAEADQLYAEWRAQPAERAQPAK